MLQAKDFCKHPAYPSKEYNNLRNRIQEVQQDGLFVLAPWWDALKMESKPLEARVSFLSQLAGDITLPNDMVGDRDGYTSCNEHNTHQHITPAESTMR